MVTIVVTPHWRWVLLITRTNPRCSMQACSSLIFDNENRNKNEYEFFDMPKYNEKDSFVNSYEFNVLRGVVDQINAVVQR